MTIIRHMKRMQPIHHRLSKPHRRNLANGNVTARLQFVVVVLLSLVALRTQAQNRPVDLVTNAAHCQACHNGISDETGDMSIGVKWRASVMANASKDPYWRASVRREAVDHPDAASGIEDQCATCHMPLSRFVQTSGNQTGEVFKLLPDRNGRFASQLGPLANDGVSCAVCHQIQNKNLGENSSFSGGFHIDVSRPAGERRVYGPFKIEKGVAHVMNSATEFTPTFAEHIEASELCATCHTLYTHALVGDGNETAVFPEQVPFLEWQHSDYGDATSCQECHMKPVSGPMPISSVLGNEREGVQQHTFSGGNSFLLSILGAFSDELFVQASPLELHSAQTATIEQLQKNAATLDVSVATLEEGDSQLNAIVTVTNDTGHKLPTAFPSRRVWVQFTVKNDALKTIFESGRLYDGKIRGNNNDADASRFEPHYDVIHSPQQVQIYEAILGDRKRRVTTGLLNATEYLKDNRIVPSGFDKFSAQSDIAVKGRASDDISFDDGADKVAYEIPIGSAAGSYTVNVKLWYQSIGYRWAANMNGVKGSEPADFSRMYRQINKDLTAVILAEKTIKTIVLPSLTITDADRAQAAAMAGPDKESE